MCGVGVGGARKHMKKVITTCDLFNRYSWMLAISTIMHVVHWHKFYAIWAKEAITCIVNKPM